MESRPWTALTELAKAAGERAGEELAGRHAEDLELAARSERTRVEREHAERVKRAVRRRAARTLDLGLALVELWYRDAAMIVEGAPELIHARDRTAELEATAAGRSPRTLHRALELVADTRERLALNVTEELALEALAYRLAAL